MAALLVSKERLGSYLVFHTSVGQTIQMTIWRDGRQVVLPLKLEARP